MPLETHIVWVLIGKVRVFTAFQGPTPPHLHPTMATPREPLES